MATAPAPQPGRITSLADIDAAALSAIAKACGVSETSIEDVYSCTPLQKSMISPDRDEMFHFVLSAARPVDPDPFCDALRQVVAHNAILRTRIVECDGLGTLNVVTDEPHVTNRSTGYDDVEDYLRGAADSATAAAAATAAPHHRFDGGALLFRSAYVGQSFVATIHHAIMDYWSIDKLLKVDTPAVYAGQPPIQRPMFKKFLAHCLDIDETAAKAFWAPRFRGTPAIFPEPRSDDSPPPRVVGKPARDMILQRQTGGGGGAPIPASHMPLYIEAAWALTAAIYTDSDSVAYGYVLSGRSATLDGVENTLGPTVAEVPVQASVRRQTATVDKLIRELAASLRQLQQNAGVVQWGLENIAGAGRLGGGGGGSGAAWRAAGFQTLVNVRPAVFADAKFGTTTDDDNIKLRTVWMRGYYKLQLIFSITPDGVTVWPRVDEAAVGDAQLDRILVQFEHALRLLTDAKPGTRLAELPLLDRRGRDVIFGWNERVVSASDENNKKSLREMLADRLQSRHDMAVEAADGSATYADLDRMSDRVAQQLRERGVSAGTPVGFLFEKSLSAIVALVGLIKAGGTCVPIEDEHDEALLRAARVEMVLTSSSAHQNARVSGLAASAVLFVVEGDSVIGAVDDAVESVSRTHTNGDGLGKAPEDARADVAFILFTGGSSGPDPAPVMVTVSHGQLASSLSSYAQRLGWQPGVRMLQYSSLASSHGLLEVLGPLVSGGCCICVPRSDDPNLLLLPAFVASSGGANWAILPPSAIRTLSPGDVPGLRSLLSLGGEDVVDQEAGERWSGALRFFRGWAADEDASMLAAVAEVAPGSSRGPDGLGMMPIGCAVWIVNPDNVDDLAPLGGVGEIVVERPGGGGAVSTFVKNTTSRTASPPSSIPPPRWAPRRSLNGGTETRMRFLRTGVLAKYNPDGSISPTGRRSNRIKLSGQTVQLEHLESELLRCGHVRDAVVVPRISAGRTLLVAVVCPAGGASEARVHLRGGRGLRELPDYVADPCRAAVRAWAASRIPADQVPAVVYVVEELVRSGRSSYLVDRAAVREWLKTKSMPLR